MDLAVCCPRKTFERIIHSPPVLPHGVTSHNELMMVLTHLGWVMHICVHKPTSIGSDNGFLPGWCQAIIWTNAGILLFRTLGTIFSEILIEIHIFPFTKMHLKMSSGKWRLFCFGLNVLIKWLFLSHLAIEAPAIWRYMLIVCVIDKMGTN